jgi:hypothetical protein
MLETQTNLKLPTPDEILLARVEAVMSAVRLLHPLLDLLEEAKTGNQSAAAGDLTEVLRSLYTTTVETAAMVREIDVRTRTMAAEIAGITETLRGGVD